MLFSVNFITISTIIILSCYSLILPYRNINNRINKFNFKIYEVMNDRSIDTCGKCPLAPKCSGTYLEKGCDGTGKIQGGIGLYLTWWPIKVFRPCPSYLQAGYMYRREGQTLDQVLFSEPSTKMKEKMEELRLKTLNESELTKENNENIISNPNSDDIELSEADKFLNEKFGDKR